MNIILLSGGSGKRLWPLSNDIRSKQFIHLFKNENGEYESMLQRVYRQIVAVNPYAEITIATSRVQVSSIKNQLGDKVKICVEPSRRDTFPAIILAGAYLKYVRKLSDEECVVVCPIDPYVQDSYFESIKKIDQLVKDGKANITLLGIKPTVPSKKYGYIIPETKDDNISKVSRFVEKPDKKNAERYISKGALWNAGVFAFKLGYVLKIAHKVIDFTDYQDLYKKYNMLAQISFDYAVVEKEPNIQVLKYEGEWKDVGTWNMITEVMSDVTKGKAILDDACKNVNVVNELDIPILVMGCKDMVIAASKDGILVSDKERSGAMKPFVEAIDDEVHFAEKSWGTYTVIDVQPDAMIIKVFLKEGKRMKYHAHERRNEIWNIVSGEGRAIVDGVERIVRAGDVLSIVAGSKHTLIADTCLSVIEIQIGREICTEDKIKYDLVCENVKNIASE